MTGDDPLLFRQIGLVEGNPKYLFVHNRQLAIIILGNVDTPKGTTTHALVAVRRNRARAIGHFKIEQVETVGLTDPDDQTNTKQWRL